jgi:hypothetical protein
MSSNPRNAQKSNPILLISMLAVGTIIITVAGYLYGAMDTHMYHLILRLGLPIMYAGAVLGIAKLCTKGTGNSFWLACFFGVWFGLFAEYIGWVFWIYFLKQQLLISPGELWSAIADIAEHGYTVGFYKGHFTKAGGNSNYLWWSVEALMIILFGFFGAVLSQEDPSDSG